jgi:ceramide glucosyltransferase
VNTPGNSWLFWVAWLHVAVSFAVYLPSLLAALARRYRSARATVTRDELCVSVLKPLRGIDPHLKENLESFAALDVPDTFEVLLLVDAEGDAALTVAREVAARYPQRFRVLVGCKKGYTNPKVASLLFGLSHAKNPFIWVTDSNTVTSDAHLRAQFIAWKEAQAKGRRPTLVHAPLASVGGSGLGARFERLHIASYNNVAAETTRLGGVDSVVGKSLLFHRDDLPAVGGLAAFGNVNGEDFMMGRKFHEVGAVAYANVSTRQALGEHTPAADFWKRQRRWASVRRNMSPGTFFGLEHFSYFGMVLVWAALGLLPWQAAVVVLCVKALGDAAMLAAFAESPRLLDVLLLPVKEVVVLAMWFSVFFTHQVNWRGRKLSTTGGTYTVAPEEGQLQRNLETATSSESR